MPDMFAQMKVAPALAPVAKPVEETVAWALTLDHFTCEVMSAVKSFEYVPVAVAAGSLLDSWKPACLAALNRSGHEFVLAYARQA